MRHDRLAPSLSTPPQINRRQWLALTALGASASAVPAWAVAPLAPPDSPDHALHARWMDRITWGSTAQGAQTIAAEGMQAWLTGQLRAPADAPLPVEAQAQIDAMAITRTPLETLALQMQQRQRDARALATEDERKEALQAWQKDMRNLQREAGQRFVLRALYSPAQLREKMTWFWMNHFNIFAGKANLRATVGDYEERAVRPHALGRFRDLLGTTTRHPAMLYYLDNVQNAAGRINENYARELMELHTLGVGGGYSQQDVQELARVLTGVGVSMRPLDDDPPRMKPALRAHYVRQGLFEFNPARHDWDAKTLLGQPIRAQGLAELDEALDRLARHGATARFVTRKIAVYLVGDAPPPALLERLARTFERTDGDIAAVLAALFQSAEFQASLGQRFRDPVQYVMAGARLVHGDQPVLANTEPLLNWMQRLAEPLYGRATPDGYPLDAATWSGSGQMSTRFEAARALGAGIGGQGAQRMPPPALSQTPYLRQIDATLAPATRAALAQAATPREWNLLFLSSPEFMHG
ncbi:DUF1800 domain-containing protein [Acidovorax sp. sic0104]|uniref:DUF1800 domain-containing protein n=1 Tax=Acidovorax sp. sic0104 TaxID=2854784 RepID=UPI001C491EDB|nr:DUF1800 domain-containing protein [Acidovorax sp. sic0104]MBV7542753.1 DUF1800 domain-containing protein [Acidovorax sp. sic0104]